MPNHIHLLIDFSASSKGINTIVVFERSFDCKLITTEHFFLEKLNYIHNNPCSGVWNLVKNPVDYEHSSARHYIGEKTVYTIADGT